MTQTILSDRRLKALGKTGKSYLVNGGAGLFVEVRPNGTKRRMQKLFLDDKEFHIGLGVYPDVGLAAAREIAQELVAQGTEPRDRKEIARRDKERLFATLATG